MPRIAGVESDIAENIYWVSSKRCLPFVSSAMTSYVQLLCGTLATSAADGIIVGHGGLKDPAEQSLNGWWRRFHDQSGWFGIGMSQDLIVQVAAFLIPPSLGERHWTLTRRCHDHVRDPWTLTSNVNFQKNHVREWALNHSQVKWEHLMGTEPNTSPTRIDITCLDNWLCFHVVDSGICGCWWCHSQECLAAMARFLQGFIMCSIRVPINKEQIQGTAGTFWIFFQHSHILRIFPFKLSIDNGNSRFSNNT